jgi:hypothetical protein
LTLARLVVLWCLLLDSFDALSMLCTGGAQSHNTDTTLKFRADEDEASLPMKIVGDIDGDGLGSTEWWNDAE